MKFFLMMTAATAAVVVTLWGQAPALSYVNEIKQSYKGIQNNVNQAAELMPESEYGFKPSPDVRDYAGEVAHAADIQTQLCSMALNAPKQGTAGTLKAKADLIKALQEANALCDQAYNSLTEANASQARPFFGGGQRTLIGVLEFNVAHHNETYGTMVPYMRMKGIVPPSSAGKGKGKGKK